MLLSDWTQLVDLMYDLTNMYLVQLKITTVLQGEDPNASSTILKFILVERNTTMKEFYHETACLPMLMKGRSLDLDYSSIAYAIEDNSFDV